MKDSEALALIAMTLAIVPVVAVGCVALSQNPAVCDVAGNQRVRDAWRDVAKPLEHAVRVTAKEGFDAFKRHRPNPGPSAA